MLVEVGRVWSKGYYGLVTVGRFDWSFRVLWFSHKKLLKWLIAHIIGITDHLWPIWPGDQVRLTLTNFDQRFVLSVWHLHEDILWFNYQCILMWPKESPEVLLSNNSILHYSKVCFKIWKFFFRTFWWWEKRLEEHISRYYGWGYSRMCVSCLVPGEDLALQ